MANNVAFHADKDGYMLARDYIPSCRLNLQIYLWKDSLQFNLHPSIPVSNASSVRIADVGTGTALWLVQLAHELPDARLDGLDVDLSQCPPAVWLPSNVSIRTFNLFHALPDDLVEAFDVIHLRLMILVVENSDPRPFVKNLFRMLKPGGWLQWDEVDPIHHCIKRPSTGAAQITPHLDRMCEVINAGGRHQWLLDLPDILREQGFAKADNYRYWDREHLLRANSDQHMMTMDEFAGKLTKLGKMEEAESVYRLINGAYAETLAGAAYTMPRNVVVAQKP